MNDAGHKPTSGSQNAKRCEQYKRFYFTVKLKVVVALGVATSLLLTL